MWVSSNISSCQELPCLVDSQPVNLLSWSPSSDWTACQELTEFAPGDLWSSDLTTPQRSASLGPSSMRSKRSSRTSPRSNQRLSILQTKFAARVRTSSINLLYSPSTPTHVQILHLLICLVSQEFRWQDQTKLKTSSKSLKLCATDMSAILEQLFYVCCLLMLI